MRTSLQWEKRGQNCEFCFGSVESGILGRSVSGQLKMGLKFGRDFYLFITQILTECLLHVR